MKNIALMIALCLVLANCSIPMTTLKNPETGKVVSCVDGRAVSDAGWSTGYSVAKGPEDCVIKYQSKGYRVVSQTK